MWVASSWSHAVKPEVGKGRMKIAIPLTEFLFILTHWKAMPPRLPLAGASEMCPGKAGAWPPQLELDMQQDQPSVSQRERQREREREGGSRIVR